MIRCIEAGGLEAWSAGSVDGDSAACSAACSRQSRRLAAWMVVLQPAGDSKRICVDFMDLCVFLEEKVSRPVTRDGTGFDGSRGPKERCQSEGLWHGSLS